MTELKTASVENAVDVIELTDEHVVIRIKRNHEDCLSNVETKKGKSIHLASIPLGDTNQTISVGTKEVPLRFSCYLMHKKNQSTGGANVVSEKPTQEEVDALKALLS